MKHIKYIFTLIVVALNLIAYCQTYSDTTWERWYGESNHHENPWFYRHEIHYDHGILTMKHIDQNSYASMLQKTDVNGYLLWSKYFSASFQHALAMVTTNENGDIFVAGVHVLSNGVYNPLVLKLNACGELEWCKRININPLKLSYFKDIKVDKNGDLICLIYHGSDYNFNDRVQIMKLTPDGDLIWHNNFISKKDYPTIVDCAMRHISINSANEYYFTGFTTFPDNYIIGGCLRDRATAMKVSEDGKEEWICPVGVYDGIGSEAAIQLTFENNGEIWSPMVGDTATGTQPGKFIFNADGEIIDYFFKPILEGITYYNQLCYNQKIENGLFASRLNYYLYPQVNTVHRGLVIFDSDLNVTAYKLNMDVVADYPMSTILSHDSLLLDISSCYNCNGTQYSDVYLAKYNADLSFADTIDDTNWVYDSLCDHAIVSDTIYLACEPVGIDEFRQPKDKTINELPLKIKASPNPAKNHIQLQMEYSVELKNLKIQVFDINGSEKFLENITFGTKEINLKTRSWASGTYVVIVRSDGKMVGNTKFVIEK